MIKITSKNNGFIISDDGVGGQFLNGGDMFFGKNYISARPNFNENTIVFLVGNAIIMKSCSVANIQVNNLTYTSVTDLLTALDTIFFLASNGGGAGGGTDKGIWNPKTNTPDIFTLLTNGGEFAVIDGLDAGETYNFDFGGTKGGVVAFTIGDKVYFNGVIFQKQESYIPTADEIIYDKTNPLLGSVKDVVDSKGSVTNVSVTSSNGITSSITNNSTTPAITLGLGNITPTSVNSTGSITGSNLSGTNTGDETKSSIQTKLGVAIVNVIDAEGDLSVQVPTAQAFDDAITPVITNLEQQINLKANQSTTYTKTEVDNALNLKADKTQIKNEVLKLTYLLY